MKKTIILLLAIPLLASCDILLNLMAPAGGYVGGNIPGFAFQYISCTGKSAEGKAYLTFTYVHRLAPQSIGLPFGSKSYAVDMYGNRYPCGPFNGQYKDSQAGVTEKVVLEIKGIPPGINSFSIVSQSFVAHTIGVTNSRNSTELTFRNVPIAWE